MVLSALAAARKDSKFLAKFLHNYRVQTIDDGSTELLVMMSAQDNWNRELVADFMSRGVRFFEEDRGLGRNGLHKYFEMMLPEAKGDWVIYFCEDHTIIRYGWNKVIQRYIKELDLNPEEPYILVPGWDNTGNVNHVLSRGYIRALGGIASHGNLDSYINHVTHSLPSKWVIKLPEMFHDFTVDGDLMHYENSRVKLSEEGKALPTWESEETKEAIARDVAVLERIMLGRRQ